MADEAPERIWAMVREAVRTALRDAVAECERIESERWEAWKTECDQLDQGRADGAAECANAIRATLAELARLDAQEKEKPDEWPTEEEVERIARGLTKGQEIALRVIAEHGKARISISSSRLMKHVNARAATSLVKLGLAGWYDNITACSTDLGRRVAVALSRTGSEP